MMNLNKINLKSIFKASASALILSSSVNSTAYMVDQNYLQKIEEATPENLTVYELPPLKGQTEQDLKELKEANESEKNKAQLEYDYKLAPKIKASDAKVEGGETLQIKVEIYEKSKVIGKQVAVVRVNDKVKYAFATSTGAPGHATPSVANKKVDKQRWRHMSATYPGKENNMDHVSYFAPAIGFHSTTIGNYPKLGKSDSHGCVRLGRPEARILYRLIKEAGADNTLVTVFKKETDAPEESDISLVKSLLAKDFNFIKMMIETKNNGDVAAINEEKYFKVFLNADENMKISMVKAAVDNYNKNELPKENAKIDEYNIAAKIHNDSVTSPDEKYPIRPPKNPIKAMIPIWELAHSELLSVDNANPDYPGQIYPAF